MPILILYAPWRRLRKRAGFARNTLIAQECDVLIALTLPDSNGTNDTVEKVRMLGKPVTFV